MTKALTTAMRAHLDGTVTTLASCWKITRTDGKIFAFTGHDRDLAIGGLVYRADSSFDRSAVESDPTMSVDNLEIQGFFDSEALQADELRAGLFDKAEVELFMVNWMDLSMGRVNIRRGWLGEVTITPSGIFKSEIRGLIQALQQNIGEFYTTQCRADLGDSRCRIPTNPPIIQRGLTVVPFVNVAPQFFRAPDSNILDDGSSVVFHDVIFQVLTGGTTSSSPVPYDYTIGSTTTDGSATFLAVTAWSRYGVVVTSTGGQVFTPTWPYGVDPRASTVGLQPSTWFIDGILTWETGRSKGLSMEVGAWNPGTFEIGLKLPMGFPVLPGDKFRIYAGCSKLIGVKPNALQSVSVYGTFPGTSLTVVDPDGCFPKFNNAANYRGEPFIPGVDFLVGVAGMSKPGFSSGGGKK